MGSLTLRQGFTAVTEALERSIWRRPDCESGTLRCLRRKRGFGAGLFLGCQVMVEGSRTAWTLFLRPVPRSMRLRWDGIHELSMSIQSCGEYKTRLRCQR